MCTCVRVTTMNITSDLISNDEAAPTVVEQDRRRTDARDDEFFTMMMPPVLPRFLASFYSVSVHSSLFC